MKPIVKIFFIGLVMLSLRQSSAQNFSAGVLSGVNVVNFYGVNDKLGSEFPSFTSRLSYNFNGYVRYKSDGRIGVTFETGVIDKGAIVDFGQSDRGSFHLLYLYAPVLVDFYFNQKFHASFGGEFGFMLKYWQMGVGRILYSGIRGDFENAIMAGVGYSFGERLEFGLRYSHGVTSLVKFHQTDENGNDIGEYGLYNHYLQFLLRFKLFG